MTRARRIAMTLVVGVTVLLLIGFVWTRILVARVEARFPPTGRLVEVDGGTVRAIDTGGTGSPTVLLLHGAFGAADDWQVSGVLEAIAATGSRAIAFDRPGHGYSSRRTGDGSPSAQASRLRDAALELGMDGPAVIVGFSWGGAAALAWALAYPEDAAALVLVNPASHPWGTGHDFVYDLVGWPVLGELIAQTWLTPIAGALADGALGEPFRPEEVPERYRESAPYPLTLRPWSFRANATDIRELEAHLAEQSARYPGLRMPVSILVSPDDRVVSPDIHARALARELPDAELVEVPGAGHQLPYVRTGVVVQAIERAIAAARGGPRPR